ncbi:MAG TPA: hypothetical protein V6C85_37540 [Allocoleopsis sp.]
MVVNGLLLPRELLALMDTGRWKTPADCSGVDRLFPENDGLCLYCPYLMESETKGFYRADKQIPMWLGAPDPDNPPGDIDPHLTVLVADLGWGFDQPIALDYRVSRDRPRVLTLQWSKQWSERGDGNRWVEIAPDIQTFADLVGL